MNILIFLYFLLFSLTVSASETYIISRAEWGANDAFLFQENKTKSIAREQLSDRNESTERVRECETMRNDFASEFEVSHTITRDDRGRRYRWPLSYSDHVSLLVVHHTALKINGDSRSEKERIRALYAYHANTMGWGDIGYNFVIGESGRIYEGRNGGDRVVAGHAYCHNIGTIGIALLGNFEVETPTQKQIQALQWLLANLAKKYDIDLFGRAKFHGKDLPTVVGHDDINSTACPGYFLDASMTQVRKNVAEGTLNAAVTFPKMRILTNLAQRVQNRKNFRSGKTKIVREPARYSRRTARSRRIVAREVERRVRKTQPPERKFPVHSNQSFRKSVPSSSIRIRLSRPPSSDTAYRGTIEKLIIDEKNVFINTLSLEEYLYGLAEEPDTESYEKQKAFAIAARSYAAHYLDPKNRKFPNMPYDGSDDPAQFQAYGGLRFEKANPKWVRAVKETTGQVIVKDGEIIKAAYFSSDDGRTRSPKENGWHAFPFAEVFISKPDPWCIGLPMNGHGVGMSGCGAAGQAKEGKNALEILQYYFPGTAIMMRSDVR